MNMSSLGGAELAGVPQSEMRELLVQKAHELFSVCDKEEKGFITKRDMQRLQGELPLDPDQLEEVFDSLDVDHNSYLTLEEFTDGFGMFMGIDTKPRKMSCAGLEMDDMERQRLDTLATLEKQEEEDDDDELFDELLDNLGAQNLFKDEEFVRNMWTHLRREDPSMLNNFEEFLSKITGDIKNTQKDYSSLESALKNRRYQHDEQVQRLYEEMEQQLKAEKEQLLFEERQREQRLREELEEELIQKDKHLQDLLSKQDQLVKQLDLLNVTEVETKQENVKLQKERDLLERRLEESDRILEEMQRQMESLRQQSLNEKRRRAKSAFQVTEGIALEREGLVKQLDLLRNVNKQLLDQKDEINVLLSRNSVESQSERLGDIISDKKSQTQSPQETDPEDEEDLKRNVLRRGSRISDYLGCSIPDSTEPTPSRIMADEDCEVDDTFFENNPDLVKTTVRTAPVAQSTPLARAGDKSDGDSRKWHDSISEYETDSASSEVERAPRFRPPLRKRPAKQCDSPEDDRSSIHSYDETTTPPVQNGIRRSNSFEIRQQSIWKVKRTVYPAALSNGGEENHVNSADSINGPLATSDYDVTPDMEQELWKVKLTLPPVIPAQRTEYVHEGAEDGSPGIHSASKHNQRSIMQTRLVDPERVFKVVIVGDSGVGKSSIMHRFCNDTFKTTFSATIGVDFQVKSVVVDGRPVALQLWDTAGQERFRSITKQYYRKADGVIIVYDVTSEVSFKNVRSWISSLQDGLNEEVVLMVIGNKADLPQDKSVERTVTHKDGDKLAHEYGALFYETSAKSGLNIVSAMKHLASLLQVREDEEIDRALRLKSTPKKRQCC